MSIVDDLASWTRAGSIAGEVLEFACSRVKRGASLLEVSDIVDEKIVKLGARPAFPSQFSCNEVAAHACASANDETVFSDEVVSVDVGVCVDGCIGDTARTVDLSGNNKELVLASRSALDAVLPLFTPGRLLSEIGGVVDETIRSHGFVPVRNLSGHGLGKFQIHTAPQVPNIRANAGVLKDGMILAVEPFASAGAGLVRERPPATVFSLARKGSVRSSEAMTVLKHIQSEFDSLPFASRWLSKQFGESVTSRALRELVNARIVTAHPPLVDTGLVSQAEHSLIVGEKPIVLTRA